MSIHSSCQALKANLNLRCQCHPCCREDVAVHNREFEPHFGQEACCFVQHVFAPLAIASGNPSCCKLSFCLCRLQMDVPENFEF
ncbi:hypothetical protein MtrunA17_Chr4g0053851 [Medicago truncatula]|uniref:Uncharacterized protein n=1 Tax=Medicago truncatula TaxID=3880 RepID=A0A396IJD4_MEDTR|nr:hypothetical protein MtrunA17_Chr4g0053851 [Medicago truncatula]